MGLKIIAGRAKTGKSTYIYDEINSEIKNNNKNLILIVPEQMTYQTEYEVINRINNWGFMDLEVLSFKRIAYKIFEEVGGLKVQEINDYGKIMLLKQVFEENLDELQVFKIASKQDGFLKEFESLIKEFKQNCVSVEFLENINEYFIDEKKLPMLKKKMSDIIKIYKILNSKTKDSFYDEEDKIDLLIESIKYSNYIKNSKIWIDGFESFNGQRLKLINELIKYSRNVTVCLNIDPICLNNLTNIDDWEAFKTTYDTYKALTKEQSNIEVLSIDESKIFSNEIKLLEKNIFAINYEMFNNESDNLFIYSSLNPYSETKKAAEKILSLIRDKDYRWKDIAVAVGDIDSYNINIKKVFTQYEIPFFLDVKRNIMDNPLTKYILSLLDMFIWDFKFDNVFEYLKTGFSPLNYDEVSKLENFALQYGIEGSMWFKPFKFKAQNIKYFNKLRLKFIKQFKNEKIDYKHLNNANDITLLIFKYLSINKVQEKIEKQVEIFKKNGMYEESAENAQIWNYIIDIFEQIIMAGTDIQISLKDYRKMIEAGFKEVMVSIIPPTLDKVNIGGVDRISYGNHKVLFILGANEGKLDSKGDEKGLLLDDEREMLLQTGMKLTNGSSYYNFKEKHNLYKLFSSPSEKLYISYSIGTTEGKSLQPSLYIEKLKQIFPKVVEETDLSNINELDNVSNIEGTIDYLVLNLREYIEGNDIDNTWKAAYAWFEENDEKTCQVIKRGLNYNNKVDKLNKEFIDKIFQIPVTMTVSKIENFAECPFKFFMDNVIKPEPRLVQKVEFYDLGNIYHKAVELFTNEISNKKVDINNLNKDEIYQIAQSCTDEVLKKWEQYYTALDANERNKYLKIKINRLVNRTAHTIIEQLKRGNFRPEYTELEIGNKGAKSIAPVEIKISDDLSIYLCGRIDRVDLLKKDDKTYVNIIDYKSSSKEIDLSDAVQGLQLQLLIYMSAIMKNGEKLLNSKPEIGGTYYFHIDDPMVDGDNLSCATAEDEIFSKLSLKGFVADDLDIITNMDNEIGEKNSSDIIPVSFKKDGSFSAKSNTLTKEEYHSLLEKADGVANDIATEILNGVININPYKKDKRTPCTYCPYSGICQFDTAIEGNNYRKLKKYKKSEILSDISTKGDDADDGMES